MSEMFFSCSMCAKPVEVTRDVWVGNGELFCADCGQHLRKHIVMGSEELHLLGERYGWEARLGDVIVGETARRVDLKLIPDKERASETAIPEAQPKNLNQSPTR